VTDESPSENVGLRDEAIIAGELGRPCRDLTGIAARCPFGYPAVIETAPTLTGGAPNPTLLYLTCPGLAAMVSRAEAAGGVRTFKLSCQEDEHLRQVLMEITRLYRERRVLLASRGSTMVPMGPRLGAGIGGPEGPEAASCLHAYGAALLAVMSGWLGEEEPALQSQAQEAWERFLSPVESSWCTDGRCGRWDTGKKPAAIDVGTISVRLLVAELMGRRPRTLVRKAEVTRLGEGLKPGGPLSEAARQRTAEVVARYAKEARLEGADTIILAATSAARDASNGEEFIRSLGRDNSIIAVMLSGAREAELAYLGASLDVVGDPVVLDVGGGSTEITRRLDNGKVRSVSLEIGASRATERWLRTDPPSAREIANLRQEAEWAFGRVGFRFGGGGLDQAKDLGAIRQQLVGVAGTITTLACLDAGLEKYDAEYLHLRTLSLEHVRELVARLSALTTAERAALPCLQAGRAPVIVGGAVIVQAAMETLGYDHLTVSERDLLDGLVMRGVL
jgi:exopolyphosphatase/guanosine-5'-triphosphate,3'-diphosphate pyrophosphatase